MRAFLAILLVMWLTLGGTSPAASSCAAPATIADNAARAAVVVYGTVTGVGAGAITVRVDRVLKGDARTPLRVFVGPGRGGAFTPVATSVDYAAAVGTDHVLYVVRGTDGELETNACGGSHAGPPDDKERAFFGVGTTAVPEPDQTAVWAIALLALGTLALAVSIQAISAARKRSAT
jgi:hypothetical protein